MFKKINFSLFLLLISFTQSTLAETKYLLNAGDQLSISVWNEEALQREVIVLPDGMISFPLAGELMAKGTTVTDLQNAITKQLSEYISDPVVSVSVTNVNGNRIHITGKVSSPGSIVMSQPLDFMQALSLAGGLSPYAKEDDIIILRRVNSKQIAIAVDYPELKYGKNLESNILLKSGDVIIIP
jgi:polysaccharide export outer membrane protein